MPGTDLVSSFRSAPWKSMAALDAFVAPLPAPPLAELVKLLDLLDNKTLRADAQAHRMRLVAFAKLVEKSGNKGLFVPLVRALKATSDPQVRAVLAQILPAVNSIADHPELCALLRSPDAQLRALVAPVLSKIGVKTAHEVLSEMLAEPSFAGRSEAMEVCSISCF